MATYPPAGAGSLGQISSAAAGVGSSPPGLWQPPGFGGIGNLTLAGQPPPQPANAAGGFGLGAVGESREVELQKEISGTIEAQVSKLIEQARLDTESKVKMELKQIRDAMMGLDQRLDELIAQLDSIGQQEPVESPLAAEAVGQLLSKIEQQWGQEIRTLKQELHQTILAHNHNADLIKHHKDTIDALRDRCAKLQGNNVKTPEIQQQLMRLDLRLKQQQKQRKLEPIYDRLAALEQRVAAVTQAGPTWRYPQIPPMSMMPPNMGTAGSVMPGKGAGTKAAYKCPTDEEVQARLSKLSVGTEAVPKADVSADEEA